MKKQIAFTVTVSGPAWMTRAMAKREIRALINEQCFYGNRKPGTFDEIDESNFRTKKIV